MEVASLVFIHACFARALLIHINVSNVFLHICLLLMITKYAILAHLLIVNFAPLILLFAKLAAQIMLFNQMELVFLKHIALFFV